MRSRERDRVLETYFKIVEGVGFQDSEECLLALLEAELGVLWEGAVDVPADDLVHILLPYADLQERVVPAPLCILCIDGPLYFPNGLHDPYATRTHLVIWHVSIHLSASTFSQTSQSSRVSPTFRSSLVSQTSQSQSLPNFSLLLSLTDTSFLQSLPIII